MQSGHHLSICIIEGLKLRVIVLFTRLFKAIGHPLVLLLGQLRVLVDEWIGSLVQLCLLTLRLLVY